MTDEVLAALISGGAVLIVALAGGIGKWIGGKSAKKAGAEARQEARETENALRIYARSEEAAGRLLPIFERMCKALPTGGKWYTDHDRIEATDRELRAASEGAPLLVLDIRDEIARSKLNAAMTSLFAWDTAAELGTAPWDTRSIVSKATRDVLGAIRRNEPLPPTAALDNLHSDLTEHWEYEHEMWEESARQAALEREAKRQQSEEATSNPPG